MTLLVLKRVGRQKYSAIWVGLVDQVCGYTPRLRAAISNVHQNSSAGNQKMQSSLQRPKTPSPFVHPSSLEADWDQSEACLVHSVKWPDSNRTFKHNYIYV